MPKKKHRKKHQTKHRPVSAVSVSTAEPAKAEAVKPQPTVAADPLMAYVAKDMRKVAIMAAGFMALLLVLSLVFSNTELGDKVYSLIKV